MPNVIRIPVNIDANEIYRTKMLIEAQHNIALQASLMIESEEDIFFFFDSFAWTFDPRGEEVNIPFILYPKQRVLINKLQNCLARSKKGEKINLVIDKPRDVGASWTLCLWAFYHWLFGDFSARFGSRKEDYVDKKGEPDTLFWKFDYLLRMLPSWFRPKSNRAYMMLENLDEEAQLSGESANPNFGRGGRKSCIVFDELSFWSWAQSSWESAGEATNLRIAMSTPPENGRDSFFWKLLNSDKGRIERFEFDWADVPSRDKDWVENQKATKSDEEFAREVMKSYEGTTEGKVYATSLQSARIEDFIPYNPSLPLYVAWDFGLDCGALIWFQKDFTTDSVFLVDSYSNSNKQIDFYVPFITGQVITGTYTYTESELDKIGKHKYWRRDISHFCGPDFKNRNGVTKTSIEDELFKYGIQFQYNEWGGRTWIHDIKPKTEMLFRRLFISLDGNEAVLSALKGARYPRLTETSQRTTPNNKPVHDWSSHFRTALEAFADNEPTYHGIRRAKKSKHKPTYSSILNA